MAKIIEKNSQKEKEKEAKLPPQIILLNSKKYGYDYSRLRFGQVMAAETSLQIKFKQMNYLSDNPMILSYEEKDEDNFVARTGACLFVPIENGKWGEYNAETAKEIKELLIASTGENYDIVEGAIMDFFSRRGKRTIISEVLQKNMASNILMSKIAKAMSSINSTKSAGSSPLGNMIEGGLSDSQM